MPVAGERFAYREHAKRLGEPVRPVEVVKEGPRKSHKVRVRWLDGEYVGMEEWVPKIRLVAPWEEAAAMLEDEHRLVAVVHASEGVTGTTPYEATRLAIGGSPFSHSMGLGWDFDAMVLNISNFEATVADFQLDREALLAEPFSYIDRFGDYHAPFPVADRLARLACERYPENVLAYIKAREDEDREALVSGQRTLIARRKNPWVVQVDRGKLEERMREDQLTYGLLRAWCGQEAVEEFNHLGYLRQEVERLRGIIQSTADWLRMQGHPVKASLLQRELAHGEASGVARE